MKLTAGLTSWFSTLLQSADGYDLLTHEVYNKLRGEKISLPDATILLIQASNYTPRQGPNCRVDNQGGAPGRIAKSQPYKTVASPGWQVRYCEGEDPGALD